MSAFPPTLTQSSTPLSANTALQQLQSYLTASSQSAYLLPNTTLQADGPRAQSDSASNLVIHNLRRVEAGLRGEWLAPSLELEEGGKKGVGYGGVDGMIPVVEEDWQDGEEYRREQSVEIGNGGVRELGGDEEGVSVKAVDREERKRRKLEKKKMEKKNRHKKGSGGQ